jgi:hypothetical protein
LFSAFGWLAALGGPCVALAHILVGAERAGLPALDLATMAAISSGVSLGGLAIVLAARSARALFDQANATRELLALERAKLGLD